MSFQERRYGGESSGWRPGGGDTASRILNALNWSFSIGTYVGIRVRVHITFVLLVILELIRQGDPAWTLRWTGLLFVSVLLHEFGHCLACRRVGGRADEILMWPLGGLAFGQPPTRPWPEFVTVIWGPLVNVILAAISYAVLLVWLGDRMPVGFDPRSPWNFANYPQSAVARLVADFYVVNYTLLLFNLLLIFYPFDGGRLVQIGLWTRLGYVRSMRIACSLGMAGAVLVALLGIAWNQMLLIVIAIFGFMACVQQKQQLAGLDDYSIGMTDEYAGAYGQPRRPSLVQRWREARAQRTAERAASERRSAEQRIDQILDKVHRSGLASLTSKERKVLERASDKRR